MKLHPSAASSRLVRRKPRQGRKEDVAASAPCEEEHVGLEPLRRYGTVRAQEAQSLGRRRKKLRNDERLEAETEREEEPAPEVAASSAQAEEAEEAEEE